MDDSSRQSNSRGIIKAFEDWFLHKAVPKFAAIPKKHKEHNWNKQGYCTDCGILKTEWSRIKPEFKGMRCGSFHRLQYATGYCVQCGLPQWYIKAHWNILTECPGVIDITDCPIIFAI